MVLLRIEHGYSRPPGETVERLLRDAGEVAWKPGMGEAVRPTAERLRWVLLGWKSVEPVQVSETLERDGPAWRSLADAGEEPAEHTAPATPPSPPWEVEDDVTEDEQ